MRFSLFSLLALPLALALPSPVSNSSELFSRDQMLTARTNLFNSLGNYGKNNNDKDEVICANIPSAPGSKKYICVCYDLDDDTCYRADSKNPDNVVKDDKLISTVIQQVSQPVQVAFLDTFRLTELSFDRRLPSLPTSVTFPKTPSLRSTRDVALTVRRLCS
jgi:hypothetical protein